MFWTLSSVVLVYFFSSSVALESVSRVSLSRSMRIKPMLASTMPYETESTKAKEALLSLFDGSKLEGNIYACPESLQPLELITRFYGLQKESYFIDRRFGAKYLVTPKYVDFVEKANDLSRSNRRFKIGQRFFQNPIISGIYEMGYRQNFENFGFPGIEKEFQEASEFFLEGNMNSIVLDLSCGSGFMTRRFSKSNKFDRVIAADLSPTMLKETLRRCRLDDVKPLPELVRCDSAKLPFFPSTLSAVHAGAAMHCWPSVSQSLAEIFRVLQPGGRYYATTFITPTMLEGSSSREGFTLFKSEDDIKNLLVEAGFGHDLGSCEVRREGSRCVVIKAIKGVPTPVEPSTTSAPESSAL